MTEMFLKENFKWHLKTFIKYDFYIKYNLFCFIIIILKYQLSTCSFIKDFYKKKWMLLDEQMRTVQWSN